MSLHLKNLLKFPETWNYKAGGFYIQIEIPQCEIKYSECGRVCTSRKIILENRTEFKPRWEKFGLWLVMKNGELC
jgi:Na+-transporting NADH:ubiquinone oxidoreductase subunit NqrF